jgi:hypothetical protein
VRLAQSGIQKQGVGGPELYRPLAVSSPSAQRGVARWVHSSAEPHPMGHSPLPLELPAGRPARSLSRFQLNPG